MQLNLSKILNIHTDKECIIVGPAIDKKKVEYLKNFDGVKISIGDTFLRYKSIKFDYIICCNGEFLNPLITEQLEIINNINSTFIFSEVECRRNIFSRDFDFLKNNLNVNYFIFDQRHEEGKNCVPKHNCCNIKNDNENIFKIIGEKFNVDYSNIKQGGTVFEISLIFSLLFGCKKIRTLGITLIPASREYNSLIKNNNHIDQIILRGKIKIKKELRNYYLKKLRFFPYLISFYHKLVMKLFNKTEISLETKQMNKNINFLLKIAKKNNVKIIYHDSNSHLSVFDTIVWENIPNEKELKLGDLINKHKKEKCIIVGGSHTMHDFNYENFDGKIIVVGTSILRLQKRFDPDYLVSANNHFPVPEIHKHLEILNNYKNMTWIFSDSALYCDIWKKSDEFLNENLKIKYHAFDDRHFNGNKCKKLGNCCSFLKKYPNRKNIFDFLMNFKNLQDKNFIFGKGASVAELALAFAILMGFEEIYIQGVDIPLDQRYKYMKRDKDRYFGYPDTYADKFLREDYKLLRKKFFYYYLKRLDFSEYMISFYQKIKLKILKKSLFIIDFKQSLQNFANLMKIAEINRQKIFILSKNSNLNKINKI